MTLRASAWYDDESDRPDLAKNPDTAKNIVSPDDAPVGGIASHRPNVPASAALFQYGVDEGEKDRTHLPAAAPYVTDHHGSGRYGAGRYGEDRPFISGRGALMTLAVHVALFGVLATFEISKTRTAPLPLVQTFDISKPPPPPEPEIPPASAAPSTTQAVTAPPVTAPSPPVTLMPANQMAVAPESIIPPVAPVSAIPAPAAPVESPGPPAESAPVTPPDFNVDQLNNPAPSYPYLSRKAREEGVVLLRVHVTAGGAAGEVRIEKSSGSRRLDDAARATVRKWRFVPASQAGKAVSAWVIVPVTFSLG
ncbi:MAG: energy transducer TonB [Sphingomonadaceae bacterium]